MGAVLGMGAALTTALIATGSLGVIAVRVVHVLDAGSLTAWTGALKKSGLAT